MVKYENFDQKKKRLENAQNSLKGGRLPWSGVAVARGTPQGPDISPPVRVGPHEGDTVNRMVFHNRFGFPGASIEHNYIEHISKIDRTMEGRREGGMEGKREG